MFFPDSAALTLRFIITSARCCVASFSTFVHCRIASRSDDVHHVLQAGERLLDPLLFAGRELVLGDRRELRRAQRLLGRQ